MKFSIFFSTALFATSILAAPRGHGLASRAERRATRTRTGAPLQLKYSKDIIDGENITHVDYSSNWAGAVLTAPPAGQTFNAVFGQFVVPTPSYPSGASSGSDSYAASVWVGIDGDTYQNAILQAGIDVTINSDGSYYFDSWYEWFPDYANDFDTSVFSFTAGDEVSVSVTSSSSSRGKVVLNNLSTGQSVTQSVSAPDSSSKLAGKNAEWIVEDFEDNGGLVPFANFGSVLFTNAVAETSSRTLGTSGADIIEIEDDNSNVLTTVSLPSSSEVRLVYS